MISQDKTTPPCGSATTFLQPPIFYSWGQEAMIWNQQCIEINNVQFSVTWWLLLIMRMLRESLKFFCLLREQSGTTTRSLFFKGGIFFIFRKISS